MTDQHDLVREQFGAHAQDYVSSAVHARGESLTRLVELTQPKHHWRVLDVSTGAGHTALAFAPHVARVIATDLTVQMLDAARALAGDRHISNVEFRSADAQALPFDEATFDLVTNRIALHHYSDPRTAVGEMARVCRSGGLVALVDNIVPADEHASEYVNRFERLRDPSHVRAHSVQELERYFSDSALTLAHAETLTKEMAFQPWASRMGASEETQRQLRGILLDAPHAVRVFLSPRTRNDQLFFTLTEAVLVGKKT